MGGCHRPRAAVGRSPARGAALPRSARGAGGGSHPACLGRLGTRRERAAARQSAPDPGGGPLGRGRNLFLSPPEAAAVRDRFGTPCYVYDRATLEAAARRAL